MSTSMRRRTGAAALITAVLATAALPTPAAAADPYDIPLPAGAGCEFPLTITVAPNQDTVVREFTDADGNIVRTLRAGRGDVLTFTNEDTGAVVSLMSNGAVTRTTPNPDGSSNVVSTGHNVVVLFPTDDPAGPSTILYVGRLSYHQTADFVFTVQSFSGRTRDICEELS